MVGPVVNFRKSNSTPDRARLSTHGTDLFSDQVRLDDFRKGESRIAVLVAVSQVENYDLPCGASHKKPPRLGTQGDLSNGHAGGVIHVWSLTHFPLFTFLDFHRWQVNYNSLQGKAFLSLPFYQYKQVKLGFTRACRGKKGLGKNLVKNG